METGQRAGLFLKTLTRSAEFHSAVSQIFNLPGTATLKRVFESQRATPIRRPADCKSAIQQTECLRYVNGRPVQ
ncbi:MAG: hypothetical protein JWQ04_2498 [Pedosphaera sp.]|nr:hypothetical protein [Pedosphaera sp.]